VGRIQQRRYVTSRNSASRKPHSSPPSPSFFAAETTTPFPVSYKSITTSAPVPPAEYINRPASLYSEKEYNRTDENWTTYHVFCLKHTYD
jgi:hypothetical protein